MPYYIRSSWILCMRNISKTLLIYLISTWVSANVCMVLYVRYFLWPFFIMIQFSVSPWKFLPDSSTTGFCYLLLSRSSNILLILITGSKEYSPPNRTVITGTIMFLEVAFLLDIPYFFSIYNFFFFSNYSYLLLIQVDLALTAYI